MNGCRAILPTRLCGITKYKIAKTGNTNDIKIIIAIFKNKFRRLKLGRPSYHKLTKSC